MTIPNNIPRGSLLRHHSSILLLLPRAGCSNVVRTRKHQMGIRLRLGAMIKGHGAVKTGNRHHQKM